MRKLFVRLLLCLAVLVPGALVASTGSAGATNNLGSAVPCGYTHPFAPNAVDYCLGWIYEPGSTWSYRIEASHHVGWWGPNHDPGTWHVFVDRYIHATGAWQEREVDMNFGDQNVPKFYNSGGGGAGALLKLVPGYAFRLGDSTNWSYMSCGPWYTESKSTYMTWSGNGAWPFGYSTSTWGGSQCQNGSGFIASNVYVDNGSNYLENGFFYYGSRLLFP